MRAASVSIYVHVLHGYGCARIRHFFVRDLDGSVLGRFGATAGGSVFSRAEYFSNTSFFGFPYNSPLDIPADQSWWYPNLPTVMRSDADGQRVNVSTKWLSHGYGHSRDGCVLNNDWNAWMCSGTSVVEPRMLVIENMDNDHEIRRVSPVALSSSSGYTDLLNGT